MSQFTPSRRAVTRGTIILLVYSGSDGEQFFANLEGVMNVNESNFHDTIVRVMEDTTSDGRER